MLLIGDFRHLPEEAKGQVPISRSRFWRVEVGLYSVIPIGPSQACCGSGNFESCAAHRFGCGVTGMRHLLADTYAAPALGSGPLKQHRL